MHKRPCVTVSGFDGHITEGHFGGWPQRYFVSLTLDAIIPHCSIHLVYICMISPQQRKENKIRELGSYSDHKARMCGFWNTGVGELPSKNLVNADCIPIQSMPCGQKKDRTHCPKA